MITIAEKKSKKIPTYTSLFVSFPFDQTIISILKFIGNYWWHDKTKEWEFPLTKLSLLIDELCVYDDIEVHLMEEETTDKLRPILDYKVEPFNFQREGIEYLINKESAMLLDQQGLGKTIQLIYTAEELKTQKGIEHCLIICGINTLKQNWKKEINKFSNESVRVIGEYKNKKGNIQYHSVDKRAKELLEPLDEFFVIINCEMLVSDKIVNAILNSKNNFDMIVIDELHKLGQATAKRSKNLLKLSNVAKYKYGLTGTLLTNSPLNAYVPMRFLGRMSASMSSFKHQYCRMGNMYSDYAVTGYKNLDILQSEIENFSLRRTKDLLDLPPKVINREYIELSDSHQAFYEDIIDGIVDEASKVSIKSRTPLGLTVRLRQASTCPEILTSKPIVNNKIERAIDIIEEAIDNGEKVIVFSNFKEPLRQLEKTLKFYKPLMATGDLSDGEVSENIDLFQNDPERKIILCTIAKMSTGVTLTAGQNMIFLDLPWTEAEFQQCQDRAHRIGTKSTLMVYVLLNVGTLDDGTIDERCLKIIDTKKAISDYILDDFVTQDQELKYLLGLNKNLVENN